MLIFSTKYARTPTYSFTFKTKRLEEPFASRRRDNSRRSTVKSMAVTLVIFKLTYALDCFDETTRVHLFQTVFNSFSSYFFVLFYNNLIRFQARNVIFAMYSTNTIDVGIELFQRLLCLFGIRRVRDIDTKRFAKSLYTRASIQSESKVLMNCGGGGR